MTGAARSSDDHPGRPPTAFPGRQARHGPCTFEKRDRPLDFLDHEIIDELMHQMRNANVSFRMGETVVPEISLVGATEQELTRDRVPYEVGLARYCEIARGQILGDDTGLLKLLFHRDDHRLLGVHAIGTGATELIHIGQAVLGLGGGLDYFLRTVFNYPTLAECYKVAALDAANRLAR